MILLVIKLGLFRSFNNYTVIDEMRKTPFSQGCFFINWWCL